MWPTLLTLKTLSSRDFPFAVQLTDTMDWNLVEEDFEFMTKLEPNGCFVLLDGSKRIGVATTISYDQIGWIGNVIVSETHRGRGAGTALVKHSINYLLDAGVKTIGLYSYLERVQFYRRLGFKAFSEFITLRGHGVSTNCKVYEEISNQDIPEAIRLDSICFGATRKKLLEPLLLDSSNLSYKFEEKGKLRGFIVAKIYGYTAEIGPLVCKKGYTNIAIELIKCTLNALPNRKVSICIPKQESEICDALTNSGFVEDFSTVRMLFGVQIDQKCIYAAESLERG